MDSLVNIRFKCPFRVRWLSANKIEQLEYIALNQQSMYNKNKLSRFSFTALLTSYFFSALRLTCTHSYAYHIKEHLYVPHYLNILSLKMSEITSLLSLCLINAEF